MDGVFWTVSQENLLPDFSPIPTVEQVFTHSTTWFVASVQTPPLLHCSLCIHHHLFHCPCWKQMNEVR